VTYEAVIRGRIEQRRQDYTLALYTAWRTEAFARTEKLQPYKTYLPGKVPERAKTIEERLAEIRARRFGDSAPTITKVAQVN
jgi:hypothetical protein